MRSNAREATVSVIAGMRKRAGFPVISGQNSFSLSLDKIIRIRDKKVTLALSRTRGISVALIALPEYRVERDLTLSDHDSFTIAREPHDNDPLGDGSCRRRLCMPTPTAFSLAEEIPRVVEKALLTLRPKPNFVCLNELAFPSRDYTPCTETAQRLRRLANKHKCMIFAGSCHDRRTLHNTSFTFYPDCPPLGDHYHKQTSAILQGEHITLPTPRALTSYDIDGRLRVSSIVCLDLLDFTSIAPLVPNHNLVLVPCYSNAMQSLTKTANAVSMAMRGGVALVNYHNPEMGRPKLSLGGAVVRPHKKEIPLGRRGQRAARERALISHYVLEPEQLERMKKDDYEEESLRDTANTLRWLFGINKILIPMQRQ